MSKKIPIDDPSKIDFDFSVTLDTVLIADVVQSYIKLDVETIHTIIFELSAIADTNLDWWTVYNDVWVNIANVKDKIIHYGIDEPPPPALTELEEMELQTMVRDVFTNPLTSPYSYADITNNEKKRRFYKLITSKLLYMSPVLGHPYSKVPLIKSEYTAPVNIPESWKKRSNKWKQFATLVMTQIYVTYLKKVPEKQENDRLILDIHRSPYFKNIEDSDVAKIKSIIEQNSQKDNKFFDDVITMEPGLYFRYVSAIKYLRDPRLEGEHATYYSKYLFEHSSLTAHDKEQFKLRLRLDLCEYDPVSNAIASRYSELTPIMFPYFEPFVIENRKTYKPKYMVFEEGVSANTSVEKTSKADLLLASNDSSWNTADQLPFPKQSNKHSSLMIRDFIIYFLFANWILGGVLLFLFFRKWGGISSVKTIVTFFFGFYGWVLYQY
jgi:hypothetical protein